MEELTLTAASWQYDQGGIEGLTFTVILKSIAQFACCGEGKTLGLLDVLCKELGVTSEFAWNSVLLKLFF